MHQYQINNNREKTELFIFSGNIDQIIEDVPKIDEIGYAGYKEKDWLKNFLGYSNVDEKNGSFLDKNSKEIKNIIESALNRCRNFFHDNRYIFIFPSSDKFIAERMGGVNGFTSYEKTILIFINPVKSWKSGLKNIIIHEMAHTLSGYFGSNSYNLGESIVHEGIAENFRESLIGGREPWTQAIEYKKVEEIFKEIKNLLDKEDSYEIHGEIFFGTGKYPNWTGYTLGYYIVKGYLKNINKIDTEWKKVFKTNPKDILQFAYKIFKAE